MLEGGGDPDGVPSMWECSAACFAGSGWDDAASMVVSDQAYASDALGKETLVAATAAEASSTIVPGNRGTVEG